MLHPLFLVLLAAFCDLHFTLATKAPGYRTDLGITINPITTFGDYPKFVVYTSVVEYSFDTSRFTDRDIAGLAQQAWEEMKQAHQEWVDECVGPENKEFIEKRRPTMMSAIAAGTRVFFASSMKANRPNILLKHADGLITSALVQCRLEYFGNPGTVPAEVAHKTHGNCGEIMATALHVKLNRNYPWDSTNGYTNIRVVAFGTRDETVQNPCGGDADNKQIGCRQFVAWASMKPIPKTTIPVVVLQTPARIVDVDMSNVWQIKDTTEIN